ncbi:hypothetical protein SprV_0200543900 [Sparganum proliferum]
MAKSSSVTCPSNSIEPHPKVQTQQRIEITDILNQCVTVFRGVSEVVKANPDLQASMRRLSSQMQTSSGEQQRRRAMVTTQDEPPPNSRVGGTIKERGGENKGNIPCPVRFPTSSEGRVSAFVPISTVSTSILLRVFLSPSAFRAPLSSPFPGPPQLTSYDTGVVSPLRPGSSCTWSTPVSGTVGRASTDSTDFVTPPTALQPGGADRDSFNLHNRYRQSSPNSNSPTQAVWRPYID